MTRLATPISTLFDGSPAEAEIVAASDCLECRDRAVRSPLQRQELFHFEAELIHEWPDAQKTFIRDAILARPGLRLATFHAASCCSAPVLKGRMYEPGGTVYSADDMLSTARANVGWLRTFLPREVMLGIENNNYYPTAAYEHVTDGGFLSRIVEENDLRFLFDIAHAHVTAHNRKIPHAEYVASLPLDCAIQLHVCKSSVEDGLAVDAHLPPGPGELAEVRQLVAMYPSIAYVTIEYYKDYTVLTDLLKTYRQALA